MSIVKKYKLMLVQTFNKDFVTIFKLIFDKISACLNSLLVLLKMKKGFKPFSLDLLSVELEVIIY